MDEELRSEVADLAIRLGQLEEQVGMLEAHVSHASEQVSNILHKVNEQTDLVAAMSRTVERMSGDKLRTNCPKCTRLVGHGQRHCGICGHKW